MPIIINCYESFLYAMEIIDTHLYTLLLNAT